MNVTVEIVRFDVPPERADDLVRGHKPARLAMDALSPGCLWSRLARMNGRRWVEVVAWRDLAAFERVWKQASKTPEIAAWFDLADPGFTIDLGEPLNDLWPTLPPAKGWIELLSSGGEDSGRMASSASEW